MKLSTAIFAVVATAVKAQSGVGIRGAGEGGILPDDGFDIHDQFVVGESIGSPGQPKGVEDLTADGPELDDFGPTGMGYHIYGSEMDEGMAVPSAEWKHRYLTKPIAERLQDSAFHGSYFERMLQPDGKWRAPTEKEVADMIIAELNREKETNTNGTANFGTALANVAAKVLGESPYDNATDAQWLLDLLILPPNSSQYEAVEDVVITTTTNHSVCAAPNKCMTHKRAVEVKNFIKNLLNENVKKGEEPSVDEMYGLLKQELDIEAEMVDKLIKNSPKIRKYLKKKFRKTERIVVKKELRPIAKKIEAFLIDAGNNMTEFEDALTELEDVSEDDVSAMLRSLSLKERKKTLEALAKPKEDMRKQIEEAYRIQNETQANDNHTYFRETGEVDEQGKRGLRYHPHPDAMRYDDHVAAFEKERHRRRLASDALLPKHAEDFQRRLDDHIEELLGHVRELRLACIQGTSNTRCVADHLETETKQLVTVGQRVKTELESLTGLLGKMQLSRTTIDRVYTVANAIFVAIGIAANIPSIGKVFDVVKKGMDPIIKLFKKIDSSSKKFDDNIRKNWDRSIGRVEKVMASFDPTKIYYVVEATGFVASIGESQCLKSAVNHLAASDLIGSIETGVTHLKNYIEGLFSAVKSLTDVLSGAAWQAMETALNSIVGAIDPIRSFFAPFSPIGDLIKKKIIIKPWFTPPRLQPKFGPNRCDSGYYHDPVLRKKCWESNSWSWESYFIPFRMRLTCRHAGMGGHWTGWCANDGYSRASSDYHLLRCWCGCWLCTCPGCRSPHCGNGNHQHSWWMPWKCHERCRGGYTDVSDMCWRSNCPWGYGTAVDKTHCTQDHSRLQHSRDTNCNHYNHMKHSQEHYIQDIFGQCWASCRHGEKLFLGMCFPESKLEVSIQDIFNAFQKIFDFIKNIPGLKEVLGAIDYVVGRILKPVTDKIDAWVKSALKLPSFPVINIDFIPFAPFKHINVEMPEPPDLNAFGDLPSKIYNNIINNLPPEFRGIADCGFEVSCISQQLGLGNPADLLEKLVSVFKDLLGFDDLLFELMDVIKCGKWNTKLIPSSDILAAVGFPDINACDIEVAYCESLDLSGAKKIIEQMNKLFEPIMTVLTSVAGERRLAASPAPAPTLTPTQAPTQSPSQAPTTAPTRAPTQAPTRAPTQVPVSAPTKAPVSAPTKAPIPDQFLPMVGINIGPALVGDHTYMDFARKIETRTMFLAPYKWVDGKWIRQAGRKGKKALNTGAKQPVGIHYRIEGALYFDIGILLRNGKPFFGMELGSRVEFKFGRTVGAEKLLIDSIPLAEKICKYWEADEFKACYAPFVYLHGPEYKGGQDGYQSASACTVIKDDWLPAIRGKKIPVGCTVDEMISLRETTDWDVALGGKFTTKVTKCVQFWYGLDKALAGHKKIFDRKVYRDAKNAKGKNGKLFNFARTSLQDIRDQLLLKTAWIVSLSVSAATKTDAKNVLAKGPKYIGSGLEGQNVENLIGFAIGIENKDNKSKSRLGPQFNFDITDIKDMNNKKYNWRTAIAKMNFGEFKFRQIFELIKFGTTDQRKSAESLAKARSKLWSGLSEQFLNFYGVLKLGGVVDINAPVYKGCYKHHARSLPPAESGSFTLKSCVYHCRDKSYWFALLHNGEKCFCALIIYGPAYFSGENRKNDVVDNNLFKGTVAVGDSNCNTPCSASGSAAGTKCGGGTAYNSVWSTNGLKY